MRAEYRDVIHAYREEDVLDRVNKDTGVEVGRHKSVFREALAEVSILFACGLFEFICGFRRRATLPAFL